MNTNKIFEILEIDTDSTDIEIKKSFRRLLFKYHPDIAKNNQDSDDKKINLIIEAYKNALIYSQKRQETLQNDLKANFKKYFNVDLHLPFEKESIYWLVISIFDKINDIFYSLEFTQFLKGLIVYLFNETKNLEFETYFDSDIDKNGIEDKNNMEEVKTIFLAILNLVEGRYDALTKVYNEEYNIESLRKSFVQYITNILKEDNYLSYRYSINSKHNTLLNDIVQSYKKVSFDIYKKEINLAF